jgi:hypothetical protein
MAYEAVSSAVRMLTRCILGSEELVGFNRLCGGSIEQHLAPARGEVLFESQKAFEVPPRSHEAT